ncbi:MAG TPA: DUF2207 domain-containing protein [Acidimicrobiales bacterium]|jgi:hypothetical protein
MFASGRRKLDMVLLLGTGVVAGVAGGAGAIVGDNERVDQMWVEAALNRDGSAQITEAIDYDFGAAALLPSKHGIFRDVPGLALDAPVQVESPDAPDDVELLPSSKIPGATRIRIGNPNKTINGEHRYQIEYPLPIGEIADGNRVFWDAVGTGWEVGIDKVEIHILAPFELQDMQCFKGQETSNDPCEDVRTVEPGHIVAEVSGLGSGEGVTLIGNTGSDLEAMPAAPTPPGKPDEPGSGVAPPIGAAAAGALLAAGPTSWLVRRAGRERVGAGGAADAAYAEPGAAAGEVRLDARELEKMATTEFAPPNDLTPAQGGVVLTETVNPEHKVAWLIQAAIDGAIDMDEEKGRAVHLRRTGPGDAESGPILDLAFYGGKTDLDLGGYDANFAAAWSQVGRQLENWNETSGLWDQAADARRMVIRGLGMVVAVVGALVAAGGGLMANKHGGGWLAVCAVGGLMAGAGLAAAIRGWELRVRTPQGSAAWLRVESFRRFLAQSEAFHAEEAAKRGVLREYTAWAVAVGEIDRWSRAVASSSVIQADAGLSYAYMAPMLMASTMSASTAPSSSSGGGGSFGGVGGGGGGGGGGSW